jgi:hypothetical protein
VETDYPWDGRIKIIICGKQPERFRFFIRKPEWSQGVTVKVDGKTVTAAVNDGYFCLERIWKDNTIEIEFNMKVRLIAAHPDLRQAAGKVAITRGPIVYCAEEADNDFNLFGCRILTNNDFKTIESRIADIDAVVLTTVAKGSTSSSDKLYCENDGIRYKNVALTLIPYFLWNNRRPGKMIVWFIADSDKNIRRSFIKQEKVLLKKGSKQNKELAETF